ncbi:MAG: hypothetical protein RL006_718 [Chloroflexota bacterium]|jgi:predicted dehydrogenase
MTKSVRFAIHGGGYIAKIHAQAVADTAGAELVAIAGRSGSASELAKVAGVPWLDGEDGLVESATRGEFDVAILCTPNTMHAPIGLRLLDAGVHLLVEKPMTTSFADAQALADRARTNGLHAATAHMWRVDREATWLRDQVAAGAIGDVYRSRGCGVHVGWGPSGWFTEARLAGGGAVADMGIHAIDTLRFVLGEPTAIAVSARTDRRFISGDVEDTASIRIDWESGGWSEVEAGWWQPYADGPESSLRLYGTTGTATLFPTAVVKGAGGDSATTIAGPAVSKVDHCDPIIYAAQIAHMVDVVNGAPSLLDACGPAAVAIMEAAYRSAASGATERVSR